MVRQHKEHNANICQGMRPLRGPRGPGLARVCEHHAKRNRKWGIVCAIRRRKGGGSTAGAQAYNSATEAIMNEDVFNGSIRKFLKTLGVSAQREIEKAVRQALAEGRLKGNEKFPARATVTLGGIGFSPDIKSEDRGGGGGAPGGEGGAAARAPSIHRPAARLDRPRPLLDLVLDELAEIFRRGAVIGDDHGAEPFEPLLHRRRLHRLDGGVVEL